MEWGAMPVSIGLAGAYAAVMVGLDRYRTRQRVVALPTVVPSDLQAVAVDPAHSAAATTDASAPVVLEQSA